MIRGYIFGDKEMVARLGRLGKAGQQSVKTSIQRLTLKLLAKVKADKLSGQVLNVRTGRLRRSINKRVTVSGNGIFGVVGANVKYGRAHELGGPMMVKAHLRMQRVAWGKKMKEPRMVEVKQHIVNYPQRSFLRSALHEMEPDIRSAMREALIKDMK